MKIFLNTLAKKTIDSFWNIRESHTSLYNQKESVLRIEVTKIEEKWLVLLILQGWQASVFFHLGTLHGYFFH